MVLTAGCVGTTHPVTVHGVDAPVVLRQPSVAQLAHFAPGAVDASRDASPAITLLCGGTVPSRLAAASVLRIPNTLSRLSVLQYDFASPSAAASFFDSLRGQYSQVQAGSCTDTTPDSARFTAVSLFAVRGSRNADASGTSTFQSGPYVGGYQYNVFHWVLQGHSVFLIRLDQAHAYPDVWFVNAVENTMNTRPTANLPTGQTTHAGLVDGVLEPGQWQCCTTGSATTISPWAQTSDARCPEILIDGKSRTLAIINELPNVQPSGVVTFVGPQRRLATVPWGAHLKIRDDFPPTVGSLGCQVRHEIVPVIYTRAVTIDGG
jgi:hypothetical protein